MPWDSARLRELTWNGARYAASAVEKHKVINHETVKTQLNLRKSNTTRTERILTQDSSGMHKIDSQNLIANKFNNKIQIN